MAVVSLCEAGFPLSNARKKCFNYPMTFGLPKELMAAVSNVRTSRILKGGGHPMMSPTLC